MKRIILFAILLSSTLYSCSKGCSYNGRPLKVGPKGGCYYVTDNGNKEYVDRSACNCD